MIAFRPFCTYTLRVKSKAVAIFVPLVPSFSKIACFNTDNNLLPDVLGDFRDEVSQNKATEAIGECSELAFEKNYKFFALGYNGRCRSGANAKEEYHKKTSTKDTNCPNGIGNGKRIVVYTFGKLTCASVLILDN